MPRLLFAGRALREGVDLDGFERVLADYERYAEGHRTLLEQVATLGTIASELLDADLRTQVRMRAASVAQERLGDADLAKAQYQSVLEEQPDHRAGARCAAGVVEDSGAIRELVELLRRKGELCEDREERAALLVRQAHLYQAELDDPESAIEALDRGAQRERPPAGSTKASSASTGEPGSGTSSPRCTSERLTSASETRPRSATS